MPGGQMRGHHKEGVGRTGNVRSTKTHRHLDAEARQDISQGMKGKKHPHKGHKGPHKG